MLVLEQSTTSPAHRLITSIQETSINLWDITSMLKAQVLEDKDLKASSYANAFTISTKVHGLQQPLDTIEDTVGNCTIDQFEHRSVLLPSKEDQPGWLDLTKDYNAKCVETYGAAMGSKETANYCLLTKSGEQGLAASTEMLHQMFSEATGHVMDPARQRESTDQFLIPDSLWPLLRRSWATQRHDVVAGRFDLSLTSEGIKVYEYNADSASCLMEAAHVQDSWSHAAGLGSIGSDIGDKVFDRLVATWRIREVQGLLHLLCDTDGEEIYHTLFMKAAAEAAGIQCKIVVGTRGWSFAEGGRVVDADGVAFDNVWKTWAWRTVVDGMTDEEIVPYVLQAEAVEAGGSAEVKHGLHNDNALPKLGHALLDARTRVIEPLWTMLPSSKSILPVLCDIYPGHPYLLKSSFELTPDLVKDGHVAKPVTGRGGKNVSLFEPHQGEGTVQAAEATTGRWADDVLVYQELCLLPKLGGAFVQFCTWAINGQHGGVVVRQGSSAIIGYESDVMPIRVVEDGYI